MFESSAANRGQKRTSGVQRRGQERRRAILDAAEALLAEQGYEAATLKAIGERAGIPTASMYHYFPDRHQVEAELLRRHMTELDTRITAMLEKPEAQTLREAVDAMIDVLCDYYRAHRSCTELWFTGRHQMLVELVRSFDDVQAERLWRHLVNRGLASADTPRLAVQLSFEVGNRLFDVAFRRTPQGDGATIGEARRLITAYLESYS
ncbi:TetR/AcrR family transcriptional regulator [Streptomyces chrestomyceticus]|uniref:TetR/AcrR family transcriptional regulator n=1 Tax=Streptomyces chrestomyceticus TaxID=68185 RepID=UPI001FD32A96|nr:TetR/AcrR family transcriptional regulator [Streptomyces chrestomyceticus]